MMGLKVETEEMIAGTVSLEQLGVSRIIAQVYTSGEDDEAGSLLEPAIEPAHLSEALVTSRASAIAGEATAFLVDGQGRLIYHPITPLIGQDLRDHEGVSQVIQGQAGATYHREPDGQEWAVGYAPVPGPGWGLIVQEPWEALIAPTMRFSLLAPLTVVIAAIISGLAITFGLYYVIHPLQLLDRQATRVAWGDFSTVNQPVGGVQEIEDLRRTLATMADQIQRYQSGMRDYIAAVTTAQEEERRRLARELHDETIQSLIALGHRVEMVQKALDKDPDRARQRLAELSELVNETQQEVRRFSRALRPLYLEDLGLTPALEMLAQEVERQSGLTISLRIEGTVRRLAPDVELTAYRITQEGLSNVVRHAQAQNVWLTINFTPDGLKLRLSDNGQGFEPPVNPADLAPQGHFGLMGIHERALLFGGQLEIHSKPGEGATVEVFLQSSPDYRGFAGDNRSASG
jgi:signal transduction histidine kinase